LVVNKAAGLLVQGDQTGDESLVDIAKRYIKDKYKKPGDVFLGLVHRLDRPTTGVIVLARTSKALTRLNQQFKDRIPKKVYRAIVSGTPEASARLEHY
jgi:23S rRNA pseudouridine1911/1915/1917 synthase